MNIEGKRIIITGAASGIGRAMAHAFAQAGAGALILADLDEAGLHPVAEAVQGVGMRVDVGEEAQVRALIERAERECGGVDIYCSNAGIFGPMGLLEVDAAQWQAVWSVNVMAHVHAARQVLPQMLARGAGHLVITASAAGLLSQIGAAPYTVSKHAAVGLAEWIQITYGDRGIGVSCLCPQAVRTAMTAGGAGPAAVDGMIEPDVCAQAVISAIEEARFLITPHPEVLSYIRGKTLDYERWISGMQRLQRRYAAWLPEEG